MVITTSAQSAGMQEPNKQNRQIAKGICRALDMIWMQDVFSISHSSDSWDIFFSPVGGKGKADYTVRNSVYMTLQVYAFKCAFTCAQYYEYFASSDTSKHGSER